MQQAAYTLAAEIVSAAKKWLAAKSGAEIYLQGAVVTGGFVALSNWNATFVRCNEYNSSEEPITCTMYGAFMGLCCGGLWPAWLPYALFR